MFPSPLHPSQQKKQSCILEIFQHVSGGIWLQVGDLFAAKCNPLQTVKRGDLCLSVTTLQPDTQKLASVIQPKEHSEEL